MSSLGKYIIISASDLTSKSVQNLAPIDNSDQIISKMEQDCACPTDDLVLISDSQRFKKTVWLEDDCACPTDGLSLECSSQRIQETIQYAIPPLQTSELNNEFSLVFNPLGHAGVIVLNREATALLRSFEQPKALRDVAGQSSEAFFALYRLAELNLLQPIDSQVQVRHSQPKTLTAWLHVTNECNLCCPYCYVHKSADHMEVERGKQAVEAVFRSALANGFQRVKLKYAGGEATLNFHTVLILHDHARGLAQEHHLELDSVVLSNGVALSGRMITELKARGIRLMISLDGVGEYHDKQRPFVNGKGSFSHVEKALDRLSAQDFVPSISITLSNHNLKGLAETVNYVLKRGLPFTINFYRENECSAAFIDLNYQDEMIISAMKEAFAAIEEDLPFHSLLGAIIDRANLDAPHDRPCGVGNSYLVINHKGGVAKCHMELEQAITDVSAPDPLQLIRIDQIGLQNPSVDEKEGCRECHWRYWCAGGCPALTYRVTGRFDVKSPNCHIYKVLFPEVLRLEGLRLLKYGAQLPV
jgi:uncharacterized protein